jgi:hypothetical protein
VLAERWRVHQNTVRPHSSLGYRPPAPQTWMATSMGRGGRELLRSSRLPTPEQQLSELRGSRATLTSKLVQKIG